MNDLPLVSVIIPCFNEERYIAGSIESFLSQTYQNIEIIVVDDGSTDKSVKIVKKYPVKLIQCEHRGVSHVRNEGIRNAKGDIIVFAEGDGKYAENYIETIIEPLKDRKIGGVLAGERRILNWNNSLAQKYLSLRFIASYELTKIGERPVLGGWAFRKEIFSEVGFYNEKMACGEDREFSERIKKKGYKFVWIPDTYMYHKEAENLVELFKKSFWTGYKCREFREKFERQNNFEKLQQLIFFFGIVALPIIFIMSILYSHLLFYLFLAILVGEIIAMFVKDKELRLGYRLAFQKKWYSMILSYPIIMFLNYFSFLFGDYYGFSKKRFGGDKY